MLVLVRFQPENMYIVSINFIVLGLNPSVLSPMMYPSDSPQRIPKWY